MQFHFDLISDLHLESWPDPLHWQGLATSPVCVVAGDVAKDRKLVIKMLQHLTTCYQVVLYIDGNEEHKYFQKDLQNSYNDLTEQLSKINKLVYLQDNVVVLNGIAFLATNGWFTFDWNPAIDLHESTWPWIQRLLEAGEDTIDPLELLNWSKGDAAYLVKSVQRLQRHKDVKKIVIVTHTVPMPDLINHDVSLINDWRFNSMGNSGILNCLEMDTEKKIHTWCFGHYHGSVDQVINQVRFTNNCRGRHDTNYKQVAYFPKRITIDY